MITRKSLLRAQSELNSQIRGIKRMAVIDEDKTDMIKDQLLYHIDEVQADLSSRYSITKHFSRNPLYSQQVGLD